MHRFPSSVILRSSCKETHMIICIGISSAFSHQLDEWRESEVLTQCSPPCAFQRHTWWELLADSKQGRNIFLRAMSVQQPRACSRHLVNISSLPLPVCEASCMSEASAVRNAKIDLHVRMWPLFPECGPDVRLPGEDSRNVTASFFRASLLLLPIWRSLPFDALLGSEKQEQERGWYKSLREQSFCSLPLKKEFLCVLFSSFRSDTQSSHHYPCDFIA